ncbi:hypothetical protein G9A89_016365 [Geosiphon pyriformis]|nr:hypothetical protein G9A89_016365 [Geosiphon pyriformis]
MSNSALLSKILEIKNNSPELVEVILISNPKALLNIKAGPEKFHKHYQNLTPTREEQKQYLEQLNTQLCDHYLIPCDFQYCNECKLIYNPPPHIIYTIPKEEEPISSCVVESESTFNPNSNFNNDNDNNNSSSFIQNSNENDLNFDSNPEQYIMLYNLSKEQKLKWFSNNNEGIMSKQAHNTNAEFNLRYLGKEVIKLNYIYAHV